jgi:hypothetical protein
MSRRPLGRPTGRSRELRLLWKTVKPLALSVALLGATVWLVFWYWVAYIIMNRASFLDFGRFYYAARAWRTGGSLYDPTLSTWLHLEHREVHVLNHYPPQVSLIFIPLTSFSVEVAFGIWWALTASCLIAASWLVRRELSVDLSLRGYCVAALVLCGATPTLTFVSTGNLTGPIALLVTVLWVQWRRSRWSWVGVLVGIAWSTKLFLLPLLAYLALTRKWTAAALAVATGLACFTLGIAVFGFSEAGRWIAVIREVQWPWISINASALSPWARVAYIGNASVVSSAGMQVALQYGSAISVVILGAGVIRAVTLKETDQAFLLLLLTSLLASPLGWVYYWWMLAPPLVACMRHNRVIRIAGYCSLPGWIIPPGLIWPPGSVLLAATTGSVYFWSLITLWVGTLIARAEIEDRTDGFGSRQGSATPSTFTRVS